MKSIFVLIKGLLFQGMFLLFCWRCHMFYSFEGFCFYFLFFLNNVIDTKLILFHF